MRNEDPIQKAFYQRRNGQITLDDLRTIVETRIIALKENHASERDHLHGRINNLQQAMSQMDCRIVGELAEVSGSHCPLDQLCDRCEHEREISKIEAERDRYREALEQIRDAWWHEMDENSHSNTAYAIATEALDPEGCAEMAKGEERKGITKAEELGIELEKHGHIEEADALSIVDCLFSAIGAADPNTLTVDAQDLQTKILAVIGTWLPPGRSRATCLDRIKELEDALDRLHKAASGVVVFVNSRERIEQTTGKQWFQEELDAAQRTITAKEPKC